MVYSKKSYNGIKITIILPLLKDCKLESDFKVNYLRTLFFEWAKTLKTKFPKNTILEIISLIF